MHPFTIHRCLAIGLVVLAGAAAAQEITLYESENFNGRRFTANSSIQNLNDSGFNDRANSVAIRGGSWQLCDDAYYRGQCVSLNPGNYASLNAMGLGGRVSSIREIGWNSGGGAGGGQSGAVGPGAGAIVLYDAPGFTGRAISLNQPVANFDDIRFNDRAASAVVNSGTWQLCVDADFQSSCEVFGPGRHGNLGGVTGQVSSARPIAGGGMGGGGNPVVGNAGGGAWGSRTRVLLYEGQNFSGRPFTVGNDAMSNLDGTGFNDRASSLRVERGYWMFCSQSNFQGECRTFGPGDYPTLPPGLNNSISSGRRISNDYPYNSQPNWR